MAYNVATNLKISDKRANYARKCSYALSNPMARKRALVDILGIVCAMDYFSSYGYNINTKKALHRIPAVLEEFKILDFYIDNYRLDVVNVFRDEQIRIPKTHYDFDCCADYYVVVKISDRIKDAQILGYVRPSCLPSAQVVGDYLYVDKKQLRDIDELRALLRVSTHPKTQMGKHSDCISMFMRFIDGELSHKNKKQFIQHLLTCPNCVKKLSDVLDFEKVAKEIPENIDIMQPYVSKKELNKDFLKHDLISQDAQNLAQVQKERIGQALSDNKKQKVAECFKELADFAIEGSDKVKNFKSNLKIPKKSKIIFTLFFVAIFLFVSVFFLQKARDLNMSSIHDIESGYNQANENEMSEFSSSHVLPQDVYNSQANPVDYSLAGEVSGEPVVATIRKVSWEIPENLADKENYKKFLQLVGKNIKLNLQNDLLLSSDFAKSNVIKLNIKIASNGKVLGMRIVQTSGSGPIDDIIKKSVSETLSYMKPPSFGLMSGSAELTLIVSL